MVYVYSFVVWPDETWDSWPRSVFVLFDVLTVRVEMKFAPEEFERFRSELGHTGFTLRECVRRPLVQLESVV